VSNAVFDKDNNLTVNAGGSATLSGSGLKLGAVLNNNATGTLLPTLTFSGSSVNLVSLGGTGDTAFTGTTVLSPAIIDVMTATGKVTGFVKVLNASGGESSFTNRADLGEISSGKFTLQAGGTITTVSGGEVVIAGDTTVESLTGGTVDVLGSKTLTVNGGSTGGVISGDGALNIGGNVTLSGLNTVKTVSVAGSNTLSVTEASLQNSTLDLGTGKLEVVGGNNLRLAGLNGTADIGNVNLTVTGGLGLTSTYSGTLSGTLTKSGSSEFTLTKTLVSPEVKINGGTLTVSTGEEVQTDKLTVDGGTASFSWNPRTGNAAISGSTIGTLFVLDDSATVTTGLRLVTDKTINVTDTATLALDVAKSSSATLVVGANGDTSSTLTLTSGSLGNGAVNLKVGPTGSLSAEVIILDGAENKLTLGGSDKDNIQTISGIGTLRGHLNVGAFGTLRPGNSPGLLTVTGDLELAGYLGNVGGNAVFETAANTWIQQAVGSRDEIAVGGKVTLGVGSIVLDTAPNGGAHLSTSLLKGKTLWEKVIYTTTADKTIETLPGVSLAQVVDAPVGVTVTPVVTTNADKQSLSLEVSRRSLIYTELLNAGIVRGLDINQALSTRLNSQVAVEEGAFYGWTSGFGSNARQKGDASVGVSGFSSSNWGDVLGADRKIGDASVGVFVSTLGSTITGRSNSDRARTTSTMGGVYGATDLGEVRLSGALAIGQSDTRVSRISNGAGVSGSADSSDWLAQVGVSAPKAFASEESGYIPSAEILVIGQSVKDTTEESNAFQRGVKVKNSSATATISKIGVEAFKKATVAGKATRVSASVHWLHNFNAERRTASAAWINGGVAGGGFEQFSGSKSSGDALRLSAGARTQLTERIDAGIQADVQVQGGQTITRGNLNIGVAF
jgi:hypothetical protein